MQKRIDIFRSIARAKAEMQEICNSIVLGRVKPQIVPRGAHYDGGTICGYIQGRYR